MKREKAMSNNNYDLLQALQVLTDKVFRYRQGARDCQKGFAKLRRKIDARDFRIAELEHFIGLNQLTGGLETFDKQVRVRRRAEWMATLEVVEPIMHHRV